MLFLTYSRFPESIETKISLTMPFFHFTNTYSSQRERNKREKSQGLNPDSSQLSFTLELTYAPCCDSVLVALFAAGEPVKATLVVAVPERALASIPVETGSTALVQEARLVVVRDVGKRRAVGGSETSIGGIVAHWGTPL